MKNLYSFNGFIRWNWGEKKNQSLHYYFVSCTTIKTNVNEWLSGSALPFCNKCPMAQVPLAQKNFFSKFSHLSHIEKL